MEKKQQPNMLKPIYYSILASIVLLNFMAFNIVGTYTSQIPNDSRSLLFFGSSFFLLFITLFVSKIFISIKHDLMTLNLLKWAIIEGVVTLGFVHSFLEKENVLMFYTIPCVFLMIRFKPGKL